MTAPRAIDPPAKRMLSRVEAAAYCGVAPSTFDKMVKDGKAPQPLKMYARNLFDLRKLDAALDALSGTVSERIEPNEWDEV
jgi:hypothetical protein